MDATCRTIVMDEIRSIMPDMEAVSCRHVLGEPALLCINDDFEIELVFYSSEIVAIDVTGKSIRDDFIAVRRSTFGPSLARISYSDPKMMDRLLEVLNGQAQK